jgi:uncharacterized protein YchJ
MDTRTGEIKTFATQKERDAFVNDKRKKGEPWWVECHEEPTKKQATMGLKGWNLCLCGSGKKFRECCRKLYIFQNGEWVANSKAASGTKENNK